MQENVMNLGSINQYESWINDDSDSTKRYFMKESTEHISSLATQIAGSCNLSGIKVSSQVLEIIEKVISGKLSAQEMRQSLVQEYRAKNGMPGKQE